MFGDEEQVKILVLDWLNGKFGLKKLSLKKDKDLNGFSVLMEFLFFNFDKLVV